MFYIISIASIINQGSTLSIAHLPGQVKIEVGQVNLGSHLPSGASENILDFLSEFLVCHFVNYNLNVTYVSGK